MHNMVSNRYPNLGNIVKAVALLCIVAMTQTAFAQDDSPIVFSNIAQKEVRTQDSDGNTVVEMVEPDVVVPGDTIVYVSEFTNRSEDSVSDIVVNNPIPENTRYVQFSARGDNTRAVYSVDGGESFASPAELTVADAEGERPAQPSDYTNIRWIYEGDLAPGASSSVSFKVTIL